jgi:mono/diheme cytochrome c family protein
VAAPPKGFMYTDPIPLMARPEPNATEPTAIDAKLAADGKGLLEVRSVYDTDGLGRMGDPVLTAADLAPGCTTAIAKTTPTDPEDTRAQVADLVKMKDPADPAYQCAPARFIRAVRAVAPPTGMTGLRNAIGETEFEMQQILGYAPIEPDGSFKLEVPADTPIGLAVVDAQGRAFQTHTNWIQVRPGERRTCDGCHSPRRGGALNSGNVVNSMPAGLKTAMATAHLSGETMASTRTRLDASALQLAADLMSTDVWADTSKAGVTAKATVALKYTGNADPADDLQTPAPTRGLINYPEHIQPLWTRARGAGGANTCTNCHTDTVKLDLRATVGGTGRLTSYDELLIGDPVLDSNGRPQTRVRDGEIEVVRGPALVDTSASEGEAVGLTRKSRLGEILFGQTLMAGAEARTAHPNPPNTAPDHAKMLNAAEKRLVAEWMDLGGQYYNDPFNGSSGVRTVSGLSQTVFEAQVMPIFKSTCASCHQPVGSTKDGRPALTTSFRDNRFVLTGSPEGDFNVTLSMISDVCNLGANRLLTQPSSNPHPAGGTAAQLPAGSAAYTTIANWISAGCH